jgi:chromosome segregation ATPase
MGTLRRWWRFVTSGVIAEMPSHGTPDELEALRTTNRDLQERVAWLDGRLKEVVERLYSIEQQYSVEHFQLTESQRDLRDERMRLAAARAERTIILSRAGDLQARIRDLKGYLASHETVEASFFDDAPIVDDSK